MKKLTELLALNKQDGQFGIEIEVEGRNLITLNDQYWTTEQDNSLRNGLEYVLTKPVKLINVKKLLNYLKKKLDVNKAELDFSFRTSVHVHVNVQDLTYNQILNMIYTYLLIEAPLMNFCGDSRKGNRFCLRIEDAEGMVDSLITMFEEGERGLNNIPRDRMRYAAINVEALGKYGSIEFRAMQGCMDVNRITNWCHILNKIKSFAIKFDNPSDIFNFYTKEEGETFFNAVLEEEAQDLFTKDTVKDIQRNFSLTLDLPFAYSKNIKKEVQPVVVKKPVYDVFAAMMAAEVPRKIVARARIVAEQEEYVPPVRGIRKLVIKKDNQPVGAW